MPEINPWPDFTEGRDKRHDSYVGRKGGRRVDFEVRESILEWISKLNSKQFAV